MLLYPFLGQPSALVRRCLVFASAAVRIFRATPWIAFATSWVSRLSLPNSCAATVNGFASSFALVEADRSVASFWRIAESDFVILCSIRALLNLKWVKRCGD
jgi:hypothetical protein